MKSDISAKKTIKNEICYSTSMRTSDADTYFNQKQINGEDSVFLEYPNEHAPLIDFMRFYDSPEIIAGNRPFKGVFAIDVSSYMKNLSSPYIKQLSVYMNAHPKITFLIFAETDYAGAMKLKKTFSDIDFNIVNVKSRNLSEKEQICFGF